MRAQDKYFSLGSSDRSGASFSAAIACRRERCYAKATYYGGGYPAYGYAPYSYGWGGVGEMAGAIIPASSFTIRGKDH